MAEIQLQPISETDRRWLERVARLHFGSEKVIIHDTFFSPVEEEGFIAFLDKKKVGPVSLVQSGKTGEIIFLDALQGREDIFTSLLAGAEAWSRGCGCKRLSVTTTNDNTDALRIYQQYGFHLSELRVGAVFSSRKKKPEIPETGCNNIPIRDEIDLELDL